MDLKNTGQIFNNYIKLLIKSLFLISLVCFAFIKFDINPAYIFDLSPLYTMFSFIFFILWQFSLAYRWHLSLFVIDFRGRHSSPMTLLTIIWLGNLMSISLFPSIIGQDTAKLIKWKAVSNNMLYVTQSILITRIAGFMGIIICGIICIPVLLYCDIKYIFIFQKYISCVSLLKVFICILILYLIYIKYGNIIKEKIKKQYNLNFFKNFDFFNIKINLLGILSQVLFIISSLFALLCVTNINITLGIGFIGVSSLARLLPLSFLGITLGEGVLSYFLMEMGWKYQEITYAVGLPVIFLYFTSILGLITEISQDIYGAKQ